jgi:hypothetical protein
VVNTGLKHAAGPVRSAAFQDDFFLSAHLAFIMADIFFLMAGLIGLRPEAFLAAGEAFFGVAAPFCFLQRAFCAALIRARAAALMLRFFGVEAA